MYSGRLCWLVRATRTFAGYDWRVQFPAPIAYIHTNSVREKRWVREKKATHIHTPFIDIKLIDIFVSVKKCAYFIGFYYSVEQFWNADCNMYMHVLKFGKIRKFGIQTKNVHVFCMCISLCIWNTVNNSDGKSRDEKSERRNQMNNFEIEITIFKFIYGATEYRNCHCVCISCRLQNHMLV